IRDNSVLKIELQGSLPAKKSTNPLDEIFRKDNKGHVSLESLKNNLIKARHHDKIKGIWLQIDHMTGSWANLEEARRLINTLESAQISSFMPARTIWATTKKDTSWLPQRIQYFRPLKPFLSSMASLCRSPFTKDCSKSWIFRLK